MQYQKTCVRSDTNGPALLDLVVAVSPNPVDQHLEHVVLSRDVESLDREYSDGTTEK